MQWIYNPAWYTNLHAMKAVCTALLCLLGSGAFAQTENWDVYSNVLSKGKASFMLDMGLAPAAPVKGLDYLIISGVKTHTCNADALPDNTEFEMLYSVSDALIPAIGMKTSFRYAGSCTYQCERLDYFYVKDTVGLRPVLEQVYKSRFTDYSYQIQIKPDAKWSTYFNFLYPNDKLFEYMQNRKMVQELQMKGIDLTAESNVLYKFEFSAEPQIQTFADSAKRLGLALHQQNKVKDGKTIVFFVEMLGKSKTDLATISAITLQLRDMAMRYQGFFIGWELAKVKGER